MRVLVVFACKNDQRNIAKFDNQMYLQVWKSPETLQNKLESKEKSA